MTTFSKEADFERAVIHELTTPELCLTAVQQYGRALWHVPVEHKTPELCLAAVKQEARLIEDCPYSILELMSQT